MKKPIGWRERGLGSLKTEWSHLVLGRRQTVALAAVIPSCGQQDLTAWMAAVDRAEPEGTVCPVNILIKVLKRVRKCTSLRFDNSEICFMLPGLGIFSFVLLQSGPKCLGFDFYKESIKHWLKDADRKSRRILEEFIALLTFRMESPALVGMLGMQLTGRSLCA